MNSPEKYLLVLLANLHLPEEEIEILQWQFHLGLHGLGYEA